MTDVLPGLWFLVRASALVLLVVLTATLVLGVAAAGRQTPAWWPRFATTTLHGDLAALSLALLAVHVATSVVDGYVEIDWLDAVVPFRADYRPGWLGLGTSATLLILAATAVAVVRRRLPPRAWRAGHYVVYVAWPVAAAHGLGMGTDAVSAPVQLLAAGCTAAVLAAVVVRVRRPARERLRQVSSR